MRPLAVQHTQSRINLYTVQCPVHIVMRNPNSGRGARTLLCFVHGDFVYSFGQVNTVSGGTVLTGALPLAAYCVFRAVAQMIAQLTHGGRSINTIRRVEYAIAAVGSLTVSDGDVDCYDKLAGDYAQRLATANRIWTSQHSKRLAAGKHTE